MKFRWHTLQDAFDAVQKYCETHSLPKENCFRLNLVCEELVVNLLKYTQTPGYHLNFSPIGEKTEIVLTYQAGKFDPTKKTEYKNKPLEEREYGGLGLVLVNSLAQKIDYQFNEKQSLNVIRIIL